MGNKLCICLEARNSTLLSSGNIECTTYLIDTQAYVCELAVTKNKLNTVEKNNEWVGPHVYM